MPQLADTKLITNHCWADRTLEAMEEHGFGSTPWCDAILSPGTCMLPPGHPGPHEYTSDAVVRVFVLKTLYLLPEEEPKK